MTARSHSTEGAPEKGLNAPESLQDPEVGTERHPGGLNGPQAGAEGFEAEREAPGGGEKGQPQPPSDEELREAEAREARRPDPRQPAYDAVYEYIRSTNRVPGDVVTRNAIIWRAVHAALDATPVGRCISSHCAEGGHILPVDEQPTCIHPDGFDGECPCPTGCDCCPVTAAVDTLRQRQADAIRALFPRTPDGHIDELLDALDGIRGRAMEQLGKERDLLGRESDRLRRDWVHIRECAEAAEQQRDQLAATLREILGRFDPAFPRPDQLMRFQATVPIEDHQRWRAVLQPAPDGGPSVAEAAANDRVWDLQKDGE